MKNSILFASMAIASGLVLANIYTSIVDVPAWGNNIPASLEIARQYYKVSNPGDFFRIFSPINQALGLLCIVLFWKRGSKIRLLLIAACVLYMAGEAMTFMYFYPRNDIMFKSDLTQVENLKTTWLQWRSMNWVRTFIITAGVICSALALHYSYVTSVISRRSYRTSRIGDVVTVS
jgi:uncharacterized membrane protein